MTDSIPTKKLRGLAAKAQLADKTGDVFLDPAKLPPIYAVRLDGACMSPVLKDGERVVLSSRDAPEPGDLIGIWLRPEAIQFGAQLRIKRLVRRPPPGVCFPYADDSKSSEPATFVIDCINPPAPRRVRCANVLALHKVIGVLADNAPAYLVSGEALAPMMLPR